MQIVYEDVLQPDYSLSISFGLPNVHVKIFPSVLAVI